MELPPDHPFYGWKKELLREIAAGGGESPCPFCSLARVRRTDYLRCARCGINWQNGEALDKDPRIERLQKWLNETSMTNKGKEKK